jgi:glutathione synthase/RimK-type ligase-like ATP-grasp enzyme
MSTHDDVPVFTKDSPYQIGLAALLRAAHQGVDLKPLGAQLIAHLDTCPEDANAWIDLSFVLQLLGDDRTGMAAQYEALKLRQLYQLPTARGREAKLRVLAIQVAGDFMANVPLEFLLSDSEIALDVLYAAPGVPLPPLPAHDVLFFAVGESNGNRALLRELAEFAETWTGPILNRPELTLALARDRVAAMLVDEPGICIPVTARIPQAALEAIGAGQGSAAALLGDGDFPLIVRPVGSHAGNGLQKIAAPADLAAYLAEIAAPDFYISRFVDYSDDDGLFRKYRIVLIKGRPFLCHMAISEHWMIHYLNAGMVESQVKRDEEAAMMASFEDGFAHRHAAAFAAIDALFQLDYVGIDCGETRDGKLLIFEVDTSMVVHAIDPVDIFPYKQAPMQRVFRAFQQMVAQAAAQ